MIIIETRTYRIVENPDDPDREPRLERRDGSFTRFEDYERFIGEIGRALAGRRM